jgi:hypothetical protein
MGVRSGSNAPLPAISCSVRRDLVFARASTRKSGGGEKEYSRTAVCTAPGLNDPCALSLFASACFSAPRRLVTVAVVSRASRGLWTVPEQRLRALAKKSEVRVALGVGRPRGVAAGRGKLSRPVADPSTGGSRAAAGRLSHRPRSGRSSGVGLGSAPRRSGPSWSEFLRA